MQKYKNTQILALGLYTSASGLFYCVDSVVETLFVYMLLWYFSYK